MSSSCTFCRFGIMERDIIYFYFWYLVTFSTLLCRYVCHIKIGQNIVLLYVVLLSTCTPTTGIESPGRVSTLLRSLCLGGDFVSYNTTWLEN